VSSVNDIKPFSFFVQKCKHVSFPLMANYKIFSLAVKKMTILMSSRKAQNIFFFFQILTKSKPAQWPRGLRRGSAAARLLRFGFETYWGHEFLSVMIDVCFR
jgi:hypothetical protein